MTDSSGDGVRVAVDVTDSSGDGVRVAVALGCELLVCVAVGVAPPVNVRVAVGVVRTGDVVMVEVGVVSVGVGVAAPTGQFASALVTAVTTSAMLTWPSSSASTALHSDGDT